MADNPKEELKRAVLEEFDKAPAKLMKMSALRDSFNVVAEKHLNFIERMAVKSKVEAMAQGRSDDGTIDTATVKRRIVSAIDRGSADGHEDTMKRVGKAVVEAIDKAPTETPTVATVATSSTPAMKK